MFISSIDQILLQKAAQDEGFGIKLDDDADWLAFKSIGLPIELRLLCQSDIYYIAVNHAGVAQELRNRWQALPPQTEPVPPPGFWHFVANTAQVLHDIIREAFHLARALPPTPLNLFQHETQSLPATTEVERLAIQRVGQTIFRRALEDYWHGCCAITNVTHRDLLRASHIVPWSKCQSDSDRLNPYNGLLLAVHLDTAFDKGLISFRDDGFVIISGQFPPEDQARIGILPNMRISLLRSFHFPYLDWHRKNVLQQHR